MGRRWRCPGVSLGLMLAASLVGCMSTTDARAQSPRAMLDAAVADFAAGRFAEAVAGFDRLVAHDPASAPYLWQRGIALYYVGRLDECRAQFEAHRTVNPNDVENAAWHFLCVARDAGPEAARAVLLPVGPDSRRPMREIYRLFRGEIEPDTVLAAAGEETSARFYAHLYLALYAEAIGDAVAARRHIGEAADPGFAAAGGYMHMVARVHAGQIDGQR